jgi:hypothetical protein
MNSDTIRLDRLSDPKFTFNYTIRLDGSVLVEAPGTCAAPNLRTAIDWARGKVGEVPLCPTCKRPVSEEFSQLEGLVNRWTCPNCKTSFLH